jgi:hypothetical protein
MDALADFRISRVFLKEGLFGWQENSLETSSSVARSTSSWITKRRTNQVEEMDGSSNI